MEDEALKNINLKFKQEDHEKMIENVLFGLNFLFVALILATVFLQWWRKFKGSHVFNIDPTTLWYIEHIVIVISAVSLFSIILYLLKRQKQSDYCHIAKNWYSGPVSTFGNLY